MASCPKIAAFVRLEVTIDFASVLACCLSFALITFTSKRQVQPSPSPAIIFESSVSIYESALKYSSYSGVFSFIHSFSAIPFAITRTVSLVDVSPSTEIMLNESSTIALVIF